MYEMISYFLTMWCNLNFDWEIDYYYYMNLCTNVGGGEYNTLTKKHRRLPVWSISWDCFWTSFPYRIRTFGSLPSADDGVRCPASSSTWVPDRLPWSGWWTSVPDLVGRPSAWTRPEWPRHPSKGRATRPGWPEIVSTPSETANENI